MTGSDWQQPGPIAAAGRSPWRRRWVQVLAAFALGAAVGGTVAGSSASKVRDENAALRRALATPAPSRGIVGWTEYPGPSPAPVTASAAPPSQSPSPPSPRPTTPPPPPGPATYARFTGSTSQRTKAFVVPEGAEWEICYDMRGSGNNAIFLEQPPGQPTDLVVNEIGPANGCTNEFGSGRYSLNVTADGPWSVTVRRT